MQVYQNELVVDYIFKYLNDGIVYNIYFNVLECWFNVSVLI